MTDFEFGKFIVIDTLQNLAYALGVYVVALGAYWMFID
jgi:hypothetical protein